MRRSLCTLLMFLIPAAGLAADLPAAFRNIIPTPQEIEPKEGSFYLVRDGQAVAPIVVPDGPAPKVSLAAEYLSKRVEELVGVAPPVVPQAQLEQPPALLLAGTGEELSFVPWREGLSPDQQEQEYLITALTNGPGYLLMGRQPLGTLYAVMTLLATLQVDGDDLFFPNFGCHDWPDIPYRWVSGAPSFDTFEERIDWYMEHKINVISAPEFYGWRMDDAETQLEHNRYARAHGVRLLNLLYGDLKLKNRRSYPDGETYVCLDEGAPSTRGFCVTNEALAAEKQRVLREFVEATEPGVLYIHFVDEDDIEDATEIWLNRCPECRKAYPNDLVEAEDGKAGAQAKGFDQLCDAIFSVKHPESGYDAARDCQVWLVSAPYTLWSEDDEAWDREVEYHCTVSRLMRHVGNVHFCIRENGLRGDNSKKRCLELAEALQERGKGHHVMKYFRLGDRRDTTVSWPRRFNVQWPMLASPAMTISFEGAGSILMAGTAPGLLKVEYCWNLDGDGFCVDPATAEEWKDTYVGLIRGQLRPPEIFGDDGFLGRMLTHLYGPTAAGHLGALYRPQAVEEAGGDELLPAAWHRWLYAARDAWFATTDPEQLRQWATLFEAWIGVNQQGIAAVEAALTAPDVNPRYRRDLERTRAGLQAAQQLQEGAARASLAYALLLEDDAEGAEREMNAAKEHCATARETTIQATGTADSMSAEIKAMVDHYEGLVLGARQIIEARERLAQAREQAEQDRAALEQELSDPSVADPSRLAGKTVVLFGDGRSPLGEILKPYGAQMVPMKGAPSLPNQALEADVIVLLHRSLSGAGMARLQQYVEEGGAVLLGGATPFYLVSRDVDLSDIALWLGAQRYGNHGGPVKFATDTALTRGLEADDSLGARKSAAALYDLLGAVPLLYGEPNPGCIMAMVHRFGEGHIGYIWTLRVSEDLQTARSQVLLRIMAWLAGD